MRCVVEISTCELQEIYDIDISSGIVIGRLDEAFNYHPDLDLGDCGGREKGISRRHAVILTMEGVPHLMDLGSINGSALNGKPLQADKPYRLSAENQVRLGTLDIRIMIG